MKISLSFFLFVQSFLYLFNLNAQIKEPLVIPRLQGEIYLDGLSTEKGWENALSLNAIQHKPNFGEPPTEVIKILITYDDEFIYFAGRLYDSEPDKIESSSRKRDSDNPNCQWFGVTLDTYNDKENAMAFFTTPSGLRWDAAINNDAFGKINVETSWNTFWDVAVETNKEGWFVEFQIPFSSLRFQNINEKVIMGLIIWRLIPRKSEWDIFPEIPPNWGNRSFYKISEAQEIVFNQVSPENPIYISPYFLGGLNQSYRLINDNLSYKKFNDLNFDIGFDVKYSKSADFTLDATVNTDFAQVEADDQQIYLTRYSLFFPEKRQFFQERSSLFDFHFESSEPNRLFHSRRIGIYQGKPVAIYGGLRMISRVKNWDLGLLNMQTAPIKELGSENFSVLRARKQVFNPFSYIGAITTARIGMNGNYNVAYGIDGVFRLFGDEYFSVKFAQTYENLVSTRLISSHPSRLRILLQRRSQKGFGYGLAYSFAGKNYNPGIGFELRKNYSRFSFGSWYGWLPVGKSFLFRHQPYISNILILRNKNNSTESASFAAGWLFETKTGYSLSIESSYQIEDIEESFSFYENVIIPKKNYTFNEYILNFSSPFGRKLSYDISISNGSFYDGNRTSFEIAPVWNFSTSFEFTGSFQFNYLNFKNRNQSFKESIGRIKVLFMLNTKFSIASFIQYISSINLLSINTRIRYNPHEGNDLYLVFNEGINTNRHRQYPTLPLANDRTLLIKYSYTLSH